MWSVCLGFSTKPPYCSRTVALRSSSAPSDNSPFSEFLPVFAICFFDDSHSHLCGVRFDVAFHSAHGLIGHLCVLLLDMSVQIICLFLVTLVGFH